MLTQSECVSGEEKLRGRKNPGRSGNRARRSACVGA